MEGDIIDFTKEKIIKEWESISEANFITEYNSGTEFVGFVGGIELTIAEANSSVPSNFPEYQKVKLIEENYSVDVEVYNEETGEVEIQQIQKTRMIPELDENEEPIMVDKTFLEYVGTAYKKSVDGTKVLMHIGARNEKGNRCCVLSHEELKCYADYFGVENLLTKSTFYELMNSNTYREENIE